MRTLSKLTETSFTREKTRVTKSRLVIVLHPIGWEGDARFLDQSRQAKQCNPGLLSTPN